MKAVKFLFNKLLLFFSIFVLLLACSGGFVLASQTDGTVTGSAWSKNIGWINFETTGGNVHVTDSVLTGNVWNKYFGWINLAPTTSGVKNDGNGNLSGYAFGKNIGWVDFTGVTINSAGHFLGKATGTNIAEINFSCTNCDVVTDWRPISARSSGGGSSGGGGGGGNASFGGPSLPLSVLINNGALYTNKKEVDLTLDYRTDAVMFEISNSPDFLGAEKEKVLKNKKWNLQNGDGTKNVYVKFYSAGGAASGIITSSIILDTQNPELQVLGLKENYNSNEEIIFSGKTENLANVNLLLDASYGVFEADANGEFYITLGKLSVGKHHLELYAKDLAQNVGKTISFDFYVNADGQINVPVVPGQTPGFFAPIMEKIKEGLKPLLPILTPQSPKPVAQLPIMEKIQEGLGFLIPQLKPKEPQKLAKLPKPIVMVPFNPQNVFAGKWEIFPKEPVKNFVLAPLPKDVAMLAQKFPDLGKTFNDVGVGKITDVQKIQNSNLSLPSLTQTLGLSKIEITPGKFIPARGVPIASLPVAEKQQIPSDIIFAKDNSGLVDFNVALSINAKGQAEQTIKTIVGKPLQLVVKIDKPAKRVSGMLVFKSRNSSPVATNNLVPLNAFTASLMFASPDLAKPAQLASNISIEGGNILTNKQPAAAKAKAGETRLVLAQFDYQDTGDGVYTATVLAPVVDGQYEVITTVDYVDPEIKPEEIKLITVVDPEGYVYEKNGDKETRILGAVVSIYWQNPETKQYELWAAKDYQQENPQTTDVRGTYSFLVPEGYYYLKVDAPGYLSYDGKPFEVKEGSGVHMNIELKTKYWFLNLVDWKTMLLIVVILMLAYNFYKDKKREKWLKN